MLFYYFVITILGLCVGSFINVLLYRLDREEGLVTGRSKCRDCATQLKWYDLIPVLSYIFLKARCRYCKKQISVLYPIVELATTSTFLLYIMYSPISLFAISYPLLAISYWLLAISAFIALLFFDYLYMILPDKITLPMIVLALIYDIATLRWGVLNPILTGLTLAGLFAIIYGVSRGNWMGFGDVKLILLIGLVFGFPVAPIVFVFATWVATICGLFLMLFKKATVKSALPFGTFLSLVSMIFILFEHELSFLSKIF